MMAWLRTTPRPEKQYSGSEESWNTGGEEAEAEEEETEPGGGGEEGINQTRRTRNEGEGERLSEEDHESEIWIACGGWAGIETVSGI